MLSVINCSKILIIITHLYTWLCVYACVWRLLNERQCWYCRLNYKHTYSIYINLTCMLSCQIENSKFCSRPCLFRLYPRSAKMSLFSWIHIAFLLYFAEAVIGTNCSGSELSTKLCARSTSTGVSLKQSLVSLSLLQRVFFFLCWLNHA